MALFENFPYTDLHQLNLDWLIDNIRKLEESQVLSVNGETGHVILYQSENVQLPDVESNVWQIIRTTDGVSAGIHFNSTTGMATIVNGETLDQIYTHDHPPVYPVYSVNGQTGAVVLYPDQYVRLPDLDDEQMANWTLFRHLNGVSRGIQFDDDGSCYVIDGLNRYKIYTANTGDNPPYPVTSVNGSTGDVQLYTEQYVQLPALTDPAMDAWTFFRILNGAAVGFKLSDDGSVSVLNGSDEYPVYIQGINDPSDFDDPTDSILALSDDVASTDGRQWGMVRTLEADNNTVGIVFKYNTVTSAYETYLKVGATETKLLTAADIPPGSGVLSVNGQTGAVVLTGEDIHVSTTDTRSIKDAFDDVDTDFNNVAIQEGLFRQALIFDEQGNTTAAHNIPVGDFVYWNNGAYIATAAIAIGDTLSGTNLAAVGTGGIFNNFFIEEEINTGISNTVTHKYGKLVEIELNGVPNGVAGTLPSNCWPKKTARSLAISANDVYFSRVIVTTAGQLNIASSQSNTYYGSILYLTDN